MFSINTKAKIIQPALKFMGKLPLGFAQRMGMVLGFILYLIPNPLKKVARINIQACFPHESPQKQQQLICGSLMHVVCSAAEYGAWWLWSPQKIAPLVKKVYGEEYLQAARARGKGILILAPHLGAWEVAQGYMPGRYACAVMYRPLRMTSLEEFVKKSRERGGGDLLPLTASGMRAAYEKLTRGELLAIMPDQVPEKKRKGVFAPFFGLSAWTMTFALKLAQKTHAAVFIGYAERLGCGDGFNIHFVEVDADIYNSDLAIAAAAMNAGIEACVRKIPEQYQWTYKRFKVQPSVEKKFYE